MDTVVLIVPTMLTLRTGIQNGDRDMLHLFLIKADPSLTILPQTCTNKFKQKILTRYGDMRKVFTT